MSCKEKLDFERKLAFHSAPSLLGIKCGSLFALDENEINVSENIRYFNKAAERKGICMRVLKAEKGRFLVYLYNESLLEMQLSVSDNKAILNDLGYNVKNTAECLDRLSERMSCGCFPHEIGIFLGYPTEDVIGFIENKGENFKLLGCWKVYGDEKKAVRIFENYKKCRNFLCNKLNEGSDLYEVLRIN